MTGAPRGRAVHEAWPFSQRGGQRREAREEAVAPAWTLPITPMLARGARLRLQIEEKPRYREKPGGAPPAARGLGAQQLPEEHLGHVPEEGVRGEQPPAVVGLAGQRQRDAPAQHRLPEGLRVRGEQDTRG